MNVLSLALLSTPGPWELLIIAFIVIIVFGPSKLSDLGKSLGEGLRNFKKASSPEEIDVTPRQKGADDAAQRELDAGRHGAEIPRSESHSKV